jgi:hypothetical protein
MAWNNQELGTMNAGNDEQQEMGTMISREQPTV